MRIPNRGLRIDRDQRPANAIEQQVLVLCISMHRRPPWRRPSQPDSALLRTIDRPAAHPLATMPARRTRTLKPRPQRDTKVRHPTHHRRRGHRTQRSSHTLAVVQITARRQKRMPGTHSPEQQRPGVVIIPRIL